MIYLLDTNIVSELRKPRPHGAVLAWRHSVPIHQIAIPGIVLAENQAGIELTRKQNPAKALELENWLDEMMNYYTVLPADGAIYREWARLKHGKSIDLDADAMIAATARILRLTVATRNVRDFEQFQVEVYDPFSFRPSER
jgi:predicted nucleic acid-binding protein